MVVYGSLFLLLFFSAFEIKNNSSQKKFYRSRQRFKYALIFLVIFIFIGFRKEIGVDWENYKNIFIAVQDGAAYDSKLFLASIILINYLELPWYYINVWCALIFIFGLHRFVLTLPRPGLALLYALPYLIIIVALGYTRQSAAVGLFLFALSFMREKKYISYFFFIILASLFHSSAIILIFLPIWNEKYKIKTIFILVPLCSFVVILSLKYFPVFDMIERYLFENELFSRGAQARLFIYSLVSLSFFWTRKRLEIPYALNSTFSFLSILSPLLLVLTFLGFSTTAADRIAIYTFPAQMGFFSYFPNALGRSVNQRRGWIFLVTLFALTMFIMWVSFTIYLKYWFPYKSYLF